MLKKDERVRVTRWLSMVDAVDVLGFSIRDNPFQSSDGDGPGDLLVDEEMRRRFMRLIQ